MKNLYSWPNQAVKELINLRNRYNARHCFCERTTMSWTRLCNRVDWSRHTLFPYAKNYFRMVRHILVTFNKINKHRVNILKRVWSVVLIKTVYSLCTVPHTLKNSDYLHWEYWWGRLGTCSKMQYQENNQSTDSTGRWSASDCRLGKWSWTGN